MKRLLIASTALVMVAGAAAAEVKVTGDARFGLSYHSANVVNELTAEYRVRAKFNMSGKTDGGLGFGASFIVNGTAGVADVTGSSMVWVSGTWGQVSVGEGVDTGDGSVGLGIADIGYKGIGVDDDAEGLLGTSAANMNYTGTFGAITVALSYDLPTGAVGGVEDAVNGDWAFGVGYKGDGYKVALGYDSLENLTIGGGVTMGAISANAIYSDNNGFNAYGFDASYKMNSATVITFAYGDDEGASGADYGVGVAYTLGGGAKMIAGIGSVDGATEAEVGMTFTF